MSFDGIEYVRRFECCVICGNHVHVAIFRGTGVCCENHRKLRDGDGLPEFSATSPLPGGE